MSFTSNKYVTTHKLWKFHFKALKVGVVKNSFSLSFKVPGLSRLWIPNLEVAGLRFQWNARDVSSPDCKAGFRIPEVASFQIVVGFWILRAVLCIPKQRFMDSTWKRFVIPKSRL